MKDFLKLLIQNIAFLGMCVLSFISITVSVLLMYRILEAIFDIRELIIMCLVCLSILFLATLWMYSYQYIRNKNLMILLSLLAVLSLCGFSGYLSFYHTPKYCTVIEKKTIIKHIILTPELTKPTKYEEYFSNEDCIDPNQDGEIIATLDINYLYTYREVITKSSLNYLWVLYKEISSLNYIPLILIFISVYVWYNTIKIDNDEV